MPNVRLLILLAVSLGLGALAWLDNRPPPASGTSHGADRTADAGNGTTSADTNATTAPDATDADLDASQYMTPPDPSTSNPIGEIEIGNLRDTVDRPLFASSRRRPPESAEKSEGVAADTAKPVTFELLGVALGGPRAIAILRKKSDGTSYRVQPGDILGGWQVAKVESRAVLLERPEGLSESVPLLRQ